MLTLRTIKEINKLPSETSSPTMKTRQRLTSKSSPCHQQAPISPINESNKKDRTSRGGCVCARPDQTRPESCTHFPQPTPSHSVIAVPYGIIIPVCLGAVPPFLYSPTDIGTTQIRHPKTDRLKGREKKENGPYQPSPSDMSNHRLGSDRQTRQHVQVYHMGRDGQTRGGVRHNCQKRNSDNNRGWLLPSPSHPEGQDKTDRPIPKPPRYITRMKSNPSQCYLQSTYLGERDRMGTGACPPALKIVYCNVIYRVYNDLSVQLGGRKAEREREGMGARGDDLSRPH